MAPKYRLDPETLRIESFETEQLGKEKGTVFGHGSFSESTCIQLLCTCTYAQGPGMGTCDLSCMGGECQPTYVGCQPCGGSGNTCGCPNTNNQTCCTGGQLDCSCYG